jgi:L-amino acid N-acyltransferase YncA
MDKTETLKDGSEIVIRLLTPKDLDALMKFYLGLPAEDRKYLRIDVTDRPVVEKRITRMAEERVFRLVALHGSDIIADGALELSGEVWRLHQGELRVIVARSFQHKGLGMILMRELYHLAVEKGVEIVVVKMLRPQKAAINICHKLGFHEEVIIPEYVSDLDGQTQDLIIMKSDIQDLLKEMEHFFTDTDWQRCQ